MLHSTLLITLKTVCGLLLACASLPLAAQTSFYPSFLLKDDLTTNAHLVVRSSETVFQVENESDATLERTWAVTILKPEGNYAAQAVCWEDDFTKVKKIEGRLYDGMGRLLRESEKKDIQDYGSGSEYEFTDNRVKVLKMENSTFPYTIEFKTRVLIRGFFRIPDFDLQRLGEAVEDASYSIVAPANYQFQWKGVNTDIQPKISTLGNEKTWKWSAKNLPAKPKEPNQPYFGDQYAEVLFAPEKVKIGDYVGDLSNWTETGRFFYTLNRDRDNLSPEMQSVVRNLTANAKTEREKIEILYRYLQDNQRYVSIQLGIGGWQTFDANFVSAKKYGDCKALSNYMKALLKVVNIPAYQALVYGDANGAPAVYPDLALPRFNHVILFVPSDQLWLECTSNSSPPGYLGNFTAGHPALLLTPEGGKLVHTPDFSPASCGKTSHIDLRLDEMGNATVQQHLVATGDRHPYYRSLANEKNRDERDKKFSENLPISLSKVQTLNFTASTSQPEATMDCSIETPGYATRSGKRMFVPINKITPLRRSLPSNDHRSLDVYMADCYSVNDTIVIHFPAGYAAENIPTGKKIESEFGTYDLQIEKEADQLRVIRRAEIRAVSVPAARYGEVRQFYLDLSKLEGAQAVLLKKE